MIIQAQPLLSFTRGNNFGKIHDIYFFQTFKCIYWITTLAKSIYLKGAKGLWKKVG